MRKDIYGAWSFERKKIDPNTIPLIEGTFSG
jgi:hypothetical protein